MTDAEVEEERERRRRARLAKAGVSSEHSEARSELRGAADAGLSRLAQFYANLELPVGAGIDEVKRAYRDLSRRYHPDRHLGDAARHRAATELMQSLTRAYETLVEHLQK